jgi:hypothetical protein
MATGMWSSLFPQTPSADGTRAGTPSSRDRSCLQSFIAGRRIPADSELPRSSLTCQLRVFMLRNAKPCSPETECNPYRS